MTRSALAQLARLPLVCLGVVTIIFLIFKMVPGDEAVLMAGGTASQADIDLLRARLGLDRPLAAQYVDRVGGLLRGDFGYSSTFRGNPLPHVLARLPATIALAAASIGLAVLIGIPAGVAAACFHGRAPDLALSAAVIGLLAVPNFWLGMILILVLSVEFRWLPAFGFAGLATLVMPTLALAARLIALIARTTRGLMLEELRKDYVRTAHAKGLSPVKVVVRHVLRNALIPTITVIGLQTGYLLGGSVVVERLFAWPGIGDLMITAIGARDYTLVQAITLVFVAGFLAVNFVVELAYGWANPRLRHG